MFRRDYRLAIMRITALFLFRRNFPMCLIVITIIGIVPAEHFFHTFLKPRIGNEQKNLPIIAESRNKKYV